VRMTALVIGGLVVAAGVFTWCLVCAAALVKAEGRWHACRRCGVWVNECGDRSASVPDGAAVGGELLCDTCAGAQVKGVEASHD